MKRFISVLVAIMVCVQAFSVVAFAADNTVFYPKNRQYAIDYDLGEDKTDAKYSLVVVEAQEGAALSLGDGSMIRHIDQAKAVGNIVTFDKFAPMIPSGSTNKYYVYIGGDGLDFATKIGELSLESPAEIEWPEITAKEITFRQTLADAFAGILPENPKATIDEVEYAGKFEVVDAAKEPDAGTYDAKLKFIITEEGDYKDKEYVSTKTYSVTVNKAAYNGDITAENQTAEFTGEAVAYDVAKLTYDEDALERGEITYNKTPLNAGEYTVTIPFTSIDTNYEDPEAVTATLTISKATVAEVDDVTGTYTAEDVKDISDVAGLAAKLPESINIKYGVKGYSEDIAVEWSPATVEWNVKGGVYEFTPELGEGKNLDVSEDFKGIISVTEVNGTLNTTAFVDKTVSVKKISADTSLQDLGIPTQAELKDGDRVLDTVNLVWSADKELGVAIGEVTDKNDSVITYTLDFEKTVADCPSWITIIPPSNPYTIKLTIKAEEVILQTPDRNTERIITYGDKLDKAIPELQNVKTVVIDDDTYEGQYKVKIDGEVVNNDKPLDAGLYDDIELEFVAMVNGEEKVIKVDGYYTVNIEKAPYPKTITAPSYDVKYCKEEIKYDESKINLAEHPEVVIDEIIFDSTPKNVGDYKVTIKFKSLNNNYYAPTDATPTLSIKKAAAKDIDDVIIDGITAEDVTNISSVEELKAMLKDSINIPYGNKGYSEDIAVTWTPVTTEWNVKGGVDYEFKPNYQSENFDFGGVQCKGVIKVEKVEGTLDTSNLSDVTVSKEQVESAITFADLDILPADLKIGDRILKSNVELVWDKTIEDVKNAAKDVTDKKDVEVTLTLSNDTFAEYPWLTIVANDTIKIKITNKAVATVAAITAEDGVYGTEIADIELPTWNANDGGEDPAASIKITYKGRGETEYAESEVKPTAAGTYTAVATLVSDIYAGSSSADFEIAPLDITYTVDDATKTYGEENPTFTGSSAEVIGEDDLGITFICDADETSPVGEYDINATAANKNYNVTVEKGVLTITKAALPETAPVIEGAAKVGAELAAELPEALKDIAGIEIQWYANGEAIDNATGTWYLVKIADSNKTITAKAVATEAVNYTGETAESNKILIEKYEIAGTLGISLNTLTLEAGTTVTADVTGIKGYEYFDLSYKWYIGEEAIENATANTFEIPADKPGVVSVVVTPSEDFAGSIKAIVGEIGKVMLPASLVLNSDAEGDIEVGSVITADIKVEEGVTEEDYDLVWLVNGEASDVTSRTYEVTKEDYGKVISAKLVAKGDIYTGEVVSEDYYELYAIAPTNVKISTTTTGSAINVKLTADANGAVPYFDASIKEKDAEDTLEVVTIFADEDGKYEYTFEGLTAGATYTIEVTAWNTEGEGETVSKDVTVYYPATEGGNTIIKKPTNNNQTPGNVTDTSVSVESKTETATVPSKDLAGKETVSATVTTDGGNKVEVAVDIKDKAVDSLTVKAETSDKEVNGKAAEGIIGEVIEVKVDAKSGSDAVEVGATIKVKADAPAYAYAVDELGNTVRLDSTYNEETGEVVVANVPDGTVLAVSTNAPVDFADVEGRWSEAEVQKAADLGIVNGRGEGYAPEALLTRSETNKLKKNLAEVLKLVLPVNEEVKIDTDPSHWAYESDLWAAQTGITTGVGTNEDGEVVISGEDNVVRQDYITLIARMIKLAIGDAEVEGEAIVFADAADIADYAADAFDLLSSIGILKGSEGENGIAANPKANITREEAAALSNRAYDFVKAVKTTK